MNLDLAGKCAIVGGASQGIGYGIAHLLAAEGASVAITARREADLRAAAAKIGSETGAEILPVQADCRQGADCERVVKTVIDAFGHIDILVNNAGIAGLHRFLDQPLDDWDRVLRVNLTGTFLCGQMAASIMARRGSGRIINIASVSGIRAGSGRTAYGVSKAGIIMLTRQMALELGRFGVTANAVAPGPVETPMVTQSHTPETRSFFHRSVPLRRYGLPEEIAGAVSYLADDDAAYVNGHVLCVDGGFTSSGIIADDVGDKLEER